MGSVMRVRTTVALPRIKNVLDTCVSCSNTLSTEYFASCPDIDMGSDFDFDGRTTHSKCGPLCRAGSSGDWPCCARGRETSVAGPFELWTSENEGEGTETAVKRSGTLMVTDRETA